MNSFFKTFLAALLAFVAGSILCIVVVSMIFAGFAAMFTPKVPVVSSNSVLMIDLSSSIEDSPGDLFSNFDIRTMTVESSTSLLDAVTAIDAAAVDNNIKGIYISLKGDGHMEVSTAEEIRAAVERFRQSGKFVVSHNDTYGHLSYYLSSVGDMVAITPEGGFGWNGLSLGIMFYKGLFDKLDLEVDIIRHGTFKAAVEPYMLKEMSPENRLQMQTYVNSLWGVLLNDISASRGISVSELSGYADRLAVDSPETALKLGLVDRIWYRDQMMNYIGALAEGTAPADYDPENSYSQPSFISLSQYAANVRHNLPRSSRNKIAVIYADGAIIDGESAAKNIGGDSVARLLEQARKDDNVKAVVFRVNSPGGSALASEIMWREVELLRAVKPVIVSMGSYAASGGYYISAPADVIIADRTTLTGSIGVFGAIMNFEKAFNNHLGITFDVVNTNKHSSMGHGFGRLSPEEKTYFQNQVDAVYNTFVGHVSAGRNMTFEEVDAIGQGRIWLGTDAREIGLVDGFGGIWDAIALAAERVDIGNDFRVVEFTDFDTSLFGLLLNMPSALAESKMKNELGDLYREYKAIQNFMRQEESIQAMMPYKIEVR